jgi:glycosyl-4,4'-diaponeurosporenoate acyltransferase
MQVLLIFAINLYANVYPIFVQRYNRLRIVRLLRKCTP